MSPRAAPYAGRGNEARAGEGENEGEYEGEGLNLGCAGGGCRLTDRVLDGFVALANALRAPLCSLEGERVLDARLTGGR